MDSGAVAVAATFRPVPIPAEIERRIAAVEKRVADLERGQIVLATAVALARWLVPISVSVAAVLVVILK